MKQRDNSRRITEPNEFDNKLEKLKANMPTKIKKGPPVGYDKRNPNQKPLASKSFILPNLLADVSSKQNQHPFFSEELGGNMLNLNQIFNGNGSDKKKITGSQSAPHIEMPGDSLREHSPSYIQVSIFLSHSPNDLT
jgi:hypothetical protein